MQNPTDQAEATVPAENGSNINGTVAVRRKAAKRSNPFDLPAEELPEHLISPSPQEAEDLPVARKKPRLEEPLPATTDEAARKTASPDHSVGLPPPTAENDANADPMTNTQPNAEATRATGRWTSEEDAKLTSAVANTPMKKWGKEYKINWDTIAALIPGRTGTQCREKWNYALDSNIVRATGRKGRWTADEDKKLKDSVPTHGDKKWGAIAALVTDRTKLQCQNRWHNGLKPSMTLTTGRAGKWAEDEDKKLKDAVVKHGGKNWGSIAALDPGRTEKKCYRRWHDALNPSIGLTTNRTGKWAEEEVTKLKDAVLAHGGKNWKKIAALVPDRSIKQCCDKWKDMEPTRGTVREKASGTLKKAPAFVDRIHTPLDARRINSMSCLYQVTLPSMALK